MYFNFALPIHQNTYSACKCITYYYIVSSIAFLFQTGEHGHWYSGLQQAGIQGRHHRCEAEGESRVGFIDLLHTPEYCAYHPHQCHYRYIDDVL